MKTTFVCLANSKKESGRCIAGIELQNNNKPLLVNGKPKWLRPVYKTEHGEVPTNLVSHIKLLDIVEIEITDEVPNGFQFENVHFDTKSISIIGKFPIDDINRLCNNPLDYIFGNKGKAVSESEINFVNHSLILIKVNEYEVFEKTYPDNLVKQIRVKFSYNIHQYDFPITDLTFCSEFRSNNNIFTKTPIYLTLSLAANHNGWHSKLVAGIV